MLTSPTIVVFRCYSLRSLLTRSLGLGGGGRTVIVTGTVRVEIFLQLLVHIPRRRQRGYEGTKVITYCVFRLTIEGVLKTLGTACSAAY